jgi:hypothetical protein
MTTTTRCWSQEVCWERTDGRLFCEAHSGDLAPVVPAAAGDARDTAGDAQDHLDGGGRTSA